MELIKKFFSDKGRVGVAIVCLLMLSITMVSAMTGESLALATDNNSIINVTFNANGGSISGSSEIELGFNYVDSNSKYSDSQSFPTPKRDNYEFLGWYTSSSGGSRIKESSNIYTSGDHTLWAHWQKNNPVTSINVTFYANGGNIDGSSYKTLGFQYIDSNSKYNDTSKFPEVTRTGYNFLGWYTSSSGGSKVIESQNIISQDEHDLYARWDAKIYTISYNANGGSGAPSSQTKTYGIDLTLSSTKPTRTGYTFKGWGTSSDDTSANYQPGGKYSSNASDTLYAIWELNNVNIKYNTNGGTIKEANGYSAKDGIIYSGNEFFIHTINYGKTTSSDGLSDYNNPDFINITRNGYSVPIDAEWICLSGDCTVGKTYDQSKQYNHSDFCDASKSNCNVVLGVNWKANKVNIKYNTNGGTIKEANGYSTKDGIIYNGNDVFIHTIDYGKSTSSDGLSDYNNPNFINIARNGYSALTGAEWLCISGCATSGKTFSQSKQYNHSDFCDASKGDCNVVLGVNWQVNKYTVKYNANGGTGTMQDSTYTYDVSKNLTANSFTRTDYTFKCWNTKADGSGVNYTDKQNIKITENLTLYAQWKANDSASGEDDDENAIKYYVRYDKNGGAGTMENSEHTYGYASNLSKNTFTRTDYTFNGWNTKADGTGTTYTDGQTISNLASANGEVVTLYAQWLEEVNDDDDGNTLTPGTGNDNPSNGSNQGNSNIDKSPQTGMIATILVSLIGIGALGGTIYYRKKFKN